MCVASCNHKEDHKKRYCCWDFGSVIKEYHLATFDLNQFLEYGRRPDCWELQFDGNMFHLGFSPHDIFSSLVIKQGWSLFEKLWCPFLLTQR